MFKKAQVVMLATNPKAEINDFVISLQFLHKGKELACGRYINPNSTVKEIRQHLYIVSDEEIKEGDYAIGRDNIVYQLKKDQFPLKADKKIIATTDTMLWSKERIDSSTHLNTPLPQPSQSFIDKYITEYNKGNIITDVMVEYEEMVDIPLQHIFTGSDVELECMKHPYLSLKVNPKDNTITIKRIKDSWTREELIDIIYQFASTYACNQTKEDLHKYTTTTNWTNVNL